MVFEKKHESCKDLGNDKETNNLKSSTSTEPAATNIMERTDTEDRGQDVDIVNINKFGAKKTSRWHWPKIHVSLKDLQKVPTRRSKRISKLQKEKTQSQVNFFLLLTRYHKSQLCYNIL